MSTNNLLMLAEAQAHALACACANDATFDATRAGLVAQGIAEILAELMEG